MRLLDPRTALLITTVFILSSTASADPIGNQLAGIITDWPAGQTGEVRIGPAESPVASAPIDAQGHFNLALPTLNTLSPISKILKTPSSYGGAGCQGTGTAQPPTGGFQTFRFGAFGADGKALSNELLWTTTNQNAQQDGSAWADLWYLDTPTTFDSTVTCPGRTDHIIGTFASGWNVAVFQRQVNSQTGALTQAVSSTPLPQNLAWYLYREMIGVGVGMGQPSTQGLPVLQVISGQSADKAGLQVGDLIVEVDGKNITARSQYEVIQLLRGGPAGSTVNLGVRRGGTGDLKQLILTRVLLRL
ncbi:PDZ domain-containing protein [Deinococcus altitudinis]|uniref:PDZ domain-containing protein n=1 Tax=Deinococcus altitudinis TaxID=468914 RepID=UPI003891A3EA